MITTLCYCFADFVGLCQLEAWREVWNTKAKAGNIQGRIKTLQNKPKWKYSKKEADAGNNQGGGEGAAKDQPSIVL